MALVIYASVDRKTDLEEYNQHDGESVYFEGHEGYYWLLFDAFKDIEN